MRSSEIAPDHLLLDSVPNIGPFISRWEPDKFKNCWNKSFRTSKILTLLYQQFLNSLISQRDMSGTRLGALSNNRWSGGRCRVLMIFSFRSWTFSFDRQIWEYLEGRLEQQGKGIHYSETSAEPREKLNRRSCYWHGFSAVWAGASTPASGSSPTAGSSDTLLPHPYPSLALSNHFLVFFLILCGFF
jgi:hypothetical protein